MPNDGPVDATDRTLLTDAESGELTNAGMARDELVQAGPKHPALREVQVRVVFLRGAGDPDERKEGPPVGHTSASFDRHDRLKLDQRLPVVALFDSGQITHRVGCVARDA